MTNSKYWVFTINNPNEQLVFYAGGIATYATWQFERGEQGDFGDPHEDAPLGQ